MLFSKLNFSYAKTNDRILDPKLTNFSANQGILNELIHNSPLILAYYCLHFTH